MNHEEWAAHWDAQAELCRRCADLADQYDDPAKAAHLRFMAVRAEAKKARHLARMSMVGG